MKKKTRHLVRCISILSTFLMIGAVAVGCDKSDESASTHVQNVEEQTDTSVPEQDEQGMQQDEVDQKAVDDQMESDNTISYKLPVSVILYEQPQAATAMSYIDELEAGSSVKLIQTVGEMIEVEGEGKTGWIPAWLVSDEAKEITEPAPYEMLIGEPVVFALYPNQPEPYGFELEPGRVVKIQKEYGDWVEVEFLNVQGGYLDHCWLPKNALKPYDDEQAKDGIVHPNAESWTKFHFGVTITGETETSYEVRGPGNVKGTIVKDDFIPNPFAQPVLQLEYISNPIRNEVWVISSLDEEQLTAQMKTDSLLMQEEEQPATYSFEQWLDQIGSIQQDNWVIRLKYSQTTAEFKVDEAWTEAVAYDPQFRAQLGTMLGKAYDKPIPVSGTFTPEMVK